MDGLMSPPVWIAGWVLILPILAYALYKVNRSIDERIIPFVALLAAAIFVAQMLNFPILGGTSGHLIGAALATFLVGPMLSIVLITVVLTMQLMFGDGGITAYGLNVLNMAVIGSLSAWLVLRAAPKDKRALALPFAAWASVFCAATACALELSLSYVPGEYGVAPWIAFPTMLASHALIGIGEAIITTGVVIYLAKVSPSLLRLHEEGPAAVPSFSRRDYMKAGSITLAVFAVGLVGFFLFASAYPDGLERLLESVGFEEGTPIFQSPLGYGEDYLTMLMAGLIGFAAIILMLYTLLKTMRRGSSGSFSGMTEVDRFALGSRLVGFDPRVKIVCTVALVVALALLTELGAVVLVLGFVLILIAISRVPIKHDLAIMLVGLPFALFASLMMLFFSGPEGALLMFLRILASLLALVVLVTTTPFFMLLAGLRSLRVPKVLVNILLFSYRFIFLLLDEMGKMHTARKARGFMGGKSLRDRAAFTTLSNTIGMAFVRASSRGSRIYDALLSRGYTGEAGGFERLRLGGRDAVLASAFALVVAISILIQRGVVIWM
ncbi:MAG: cobalt ECF transporter T component CbiQ [Methanomassiliicoccales archaeon]|nr:cobalt ECF transporter T component CbiQ [Methanomassiliicoccales archaeon]